MRFTAMPLAGAFTVEGDEAVDERGSFLRVFCQREFRAHGLPPTFVQTSISRNRLRGTLRGLHYQAAPRAEGKLVRCIRGSLYDVIVDLRPESPTFGQHIGVQLDEENHRALYVPERFGHGFITLKDNTVASYQVGEFYTPAEEGGLRYDDPDLGIDWRFPASDLVLSDKDRRHPRLSDLPRYFDVAEPAACA